MASRKRPSTPTSQVILREMRSHSVILEDMRSQNRATIEAVEASHSVLEQRIERLQQDTRKRFEIVDSAIRDLSQDTRARDEGLGTAIRDLGRETRARDEELEAAMQETRSRVAALEVAIQRLDQDSRSRDASLEVAVRDLRVGVQQNSVDLRDLAGKVETLTRLEARVAALERRSTA